MPMKKNSSWGVLRSCHATAYKTYTASLPYVLSDDGCRRIVADIDAPASAVRALCRHAAFAASRGVFATRREGKAA